jgi:hypothetical protein
MYSFRLFGHTYIIAFFANMHISRDAIFALFFMKLREAYFRAATIKNIVEINNLKKKL